MGQCMMDDDQEGRICVLLHLTYIPSACNLSAARENSTIARSTIQAERAGLAAFPAGRACRRLVYRYTVVSGDLLP